MRPTPLALSLALVLATAAAVAPTAQAKPAMPPPPATITPVEPAPDSYEAQAEAFLASLVFQDDGSARISDARASIPVVPGYRYLGPADARRVLEQLWGNPPDASVLGMFVPRSPSLAADGAWAVIVTWHPEGYISDEDAADLDADDILADMRESTAAENEQRTAAGFPTVELAGWAAPPRYDAAQHRLYWAKRLRFEGADADTLNYDIRVLGRRGYLSLTAVANAADLPVVEPGMGALLDAVAFDPGETYADYQEGIDPVAAYGVGALVTGALAKKAGLFAALLAFLAKGWKLVAIAVVGGVALLRKLFAGREEQRRGGTIR
jgi:uncharacterized membrane-anchored protein